MSVWLELYLAGWNSYIRSVRQVRAKKHGVGAQPWRITFYLAACSRFVVYGQHYPNSGSFRWLRKRLEGPLAALQAEAKEAQG